jgi:hypothetical protein
VKAISLWQPWASLWCSPRKIHETRHWGIQVPTDGFWLAVHATKRFEKDHPPALAEILRGQFGADWFDTLPTGAIIGRVLVVSCTKVRTTDFSDSSQDDLACGDFSFGRFLWRRREFEVLTQPVPWRGAQGMFSVPDHLFQPKENLHEQV